MALTAGHVFQRTAEGIRENAGPLLGVIAVFTLPAAIVGGVVGRLVNPLALEGSDLGPLMAATIGGSVVSVLFYFVAQAAALFVALDWLAGESPEFGTAARRAVSRLGGVIATAVLLYLIFLVGFLLCIIPGVFAIVALGLAIPALLAEGLGPIDSMRRSWDLTKGHRLLIFTVFLAVGMASMIISLVLQFATAGNVFTDPMAPYSMSLTAWIVQQFLSYVVGILVSAVFAVLAAVIYTEVRSMKEGVDVESMATVFQ